MNMPIRSGGIFVPTDLIFVPLSMPKAAAVLKIVNSARNPPDVYKRQPHYIETVWGAGYRFRGQ